MVFLGILHLGKLFNKRKAPLESQVTTYFKVTDVRPTRKIRRVRQLIGGRTGLE